MIKTKSLEFPPDILISDQLKDLILKMVVIDPLKRIGYEGILDHVWMKDTSEEEDSKEVLKSIYEGIPSKSIGSKIEVNPLDELLLKLARKYV